MTKNVAKNVAQGKVQDLTEQWKKGELETQKDYFVKFNAQWFDSTKEFMICRVFLDKDNEFFYQYDSFDVCLIPDTEIKEVLAPVPSYEEYSRLEWYAGCGPDRIVELNHENRKLKELLKECQGVLLTYSNMHGNYELYDKINEVLNVAED